MSPDMLKSDFLLNHVPILGVVQKKADTPLAAAIRSHPNVRLIEVSEENRDVLLPEILSALRS